MRKSLFLVVLFLIPSAMYASSKCGLTVYVDRTINNAELVVTLLNVDTNVEKELKLEPKSPDGRFKSLPCDDKYELYATEYYPQLRPYGPFAYIENPFTLEQNLAVFYPSRFERIEASPVQGSFNQEEKS